MVTSKANFYLDACVAGVAAAFSPEQPVLLGRQTRMKSGAPEPLHDSKSLSCHGRAPRGQLTELVAFHVSLSSVLVRTMRETRPDSCREAASYKAARGGSWPAQPLLALPPFHSHGFLRFWCQAVDASTYYQHAIVQDCKDADWQLKCIHPGH